MKRFALVALLAAMLFGVASSASATELKVKGNLDVYGMWSANLRDFDSDTGDADNYYTTQRMRVYFDFVASENLKAVLGLEMNTDWGQGADGDWGTDGTNIMRVKHAYMDFMFPDTTINVKAGLQTISLPSVFGNPVFDDDAAALIVSAPINEMFGLTVGYTRGVDKSDNYDYDSETKALSKEDVDMAFLAAPITLDGFSVTPYFAYAWVGENSDKKLTTQGLNLGDDVDIWVLGANAELTMFDPLTFAADLIYGQAEADDTDFESKGWYSALAASYKMDMLTATLFGTYATGFEDDNDDQKLLPTLAEGWELTPYLGGARAFSTGASDGFASDTLGVGNDGTGMWTVGIKLSDITFIEKLSHNLTIAYAEGTSDKEAGVDFDEKDSAWEVYMVNKYMIYENLAAINELGFFAPEFDDADEDNSYFATVGFSYKF
ncbi:MAG: outer membrane homotrimeric porin [Desulfomicrobium apsheronum]|nr:outer membrane homotrimeric porin [Desulfomicrobium apsheronum]